MNPALLVYVVACGVIATIFLIEEAKRDVEQTDFTNMLMILLSPVIVPGVALFAGVEWLTGALLRRNRRA
ncbi:hypothetical protein [Deinococcus kurensis]|uniref:hypothetical protein n=1 Tax=Deinococcus kurensis TaxID=2662757 RepID=UPI0012D2E35C|nr:hypothetical protein [Deinococcus kurensis]